MLSSNNIFNPSNHNVVMGIAGPRLYYKSTNPSLMASKNNSGKHSQNTSITNSNNVSLTTSANAVVSSYALNTIYENKP